MRITDPASGRTYIEKRRIRYNEPGQPRELTFSCYLLVYPGDVPERMADFLRAVKEPVARRAIDYIKAHAPTWLERLTVREGSRIRRRFWQPGGGYDRNITSMAALRAIIDYLHANPVRRGLVAYAQDWAWSSARWYAGLRPVPLEMDQQVLVELARG